MFYSTNPERFKGNFRVKTEAKGKEGDFFFILDGEKQFYPLNMMPTAELWNRLAADRTSYSIFEEHMGQYLDVKITKDDVLSLSHLPRGETICRKFYSVPSVVYGNYPGS